MNDKNKPEPADADLRRRAEKQLAKKSALDLSHTEKDAPKLLHELQVHQIELEMQNEELRRAQEELNAARARYFDLYDMAPVGYFVISEKGLILEANLTAATLLGLVRGELVKRPITRFILPEDQDIYYRCRRRLLETGEPQVCELWMVKKLRAPFWARLEASTAQDAADVPAHRVVMSDLTERKRAENALRESEENQRQLLEASHSLIYVIGRDNKIRYANPAALRALGRTAEDVIGKHQSSFFPQENAAIQKKTLGDVEREYIMSVLDRHGGNQTRTAEQLGIGSATLYRKLKCYGLVGSKKTGRKDVPAKS